MKIVPLHVSAAAKERLKIDAKRRGKLLKRHSGDVIKAGLQALRDAENGKAAKEV